MRTPWPAGVALMALALTGCVGPSPTPRPTGPVTGLPDGVSLPATVPVDVPNDPADRLDVAINDCESADGGWQAAGTVVNPAQDAASYEITVFFTTQTGTVIGFGSTTIEVAGTETAEWSVQSQFTPAPDTMCVLRGAIAR